MVIIHCYPREKKNTCKSLQQKDTHLSAYLRVLSVCSHDPAFGEIQEIITVLEFPTKESRRTSVSLLPRKGICI